MSSSPPSSDLLDSELAQMQAEILAEHKGVKIVIVNGPTIVVRPLSMEELLSPGLQKDLAVITKTVLGAIDKLAPLLAADAMPDAAAIDTLLEIFTPVLDPVKRAMAACINQPLSAIPHWYAPTVLHHFFTQNFAGPRLKPWGDLVRMVGAAMKNRTGSTSRSPWSSSSSPSAGTSDGGATPSTSSNSTSGPVSETTPSSPPPNSNSATSP